MALFVRPYVFTLFWRSAFARISSISRIVHLCHWQVVLLPRCSVCLLPVLIVLGHYYFLKLHTCRGRSLLVGNRHQHKQTNISGKLRLVSRGQLSGRLSIPLSLCLTSSCPSVLLSGYRSRGFSSPAPPLRPFASRNVKVYAIYVRAPTLHCTLCYITGSPR